MRSKKSFYISWTICLTFCIAAFALLVLGFTQYGISMFCVFPIILGVATGIIPDRRGAVQGLVVGLSSFFILLLITGYEGVICLIMAAPIVSVLVFIGYLISYLSNRKKNKASTKTYVTLIPFLFFVASSGIESSIDNNQTKQMVTSSIVLPFSANQVYDEIIHVDTVKAEKGILHRLGLPRPLNCTLTEEKIGGLRICEFEDGKIVETITAFKRGEYLKMEVTEFGLKGRSWLRFDEDIYEIKEVKQGTQISRTTSYFSELKPRWYWSKIEALTIKAEQDLVLRNLKLDLDARQ